MFARKQVLGLLLALYVALFAWLLISGYLLGDAAFWIGTCMVPVVLSVPAHRERSLRLLPIVLLLIIGSFFIKARSFGYLLIVTSVLFAIESCRGKTGPFLLCLLLVISPLFSYLSEVFTFPIRLQLGEWSGKLLQLSGLPVEVSGNIIHLNQSEFSVDPACMGLQMTGFAFLSGIFLIAHYQRTTRKQLSVLTFLVLMILIFGFNILCNLMRILVLVMFGISPQNPLHDVVGAISLLAYVWLPVTFLVRLAFTHFSKPIEPSYKASDIRPAVLFTNVLIAAACTGFILLPRKATVKKTSTSPVVLNTRYQATQLNAGVTRFQDQKTLIYSPYTCWKGSGYDFTNIKEGTVSGNRIYMGTLKKGHDRLLTAWWFSNRTHNTISQLDWRWRVLLGEPDFQLINVTAANEEDLNLTIREWL
jgi:exosortase N